MKNKIVKYFSPIYLAQASGIIDTNPNSPWGKIKTVFGKNPGPAGETTLGSFIASVVEILLLVSASIAVLFIIYGGYRYVLSKGNEEATESAKKTLSSAVLGLVIIVLSFIMVRIIITVLLEGKAGLGIIGA